MSDPARTEPLEMLVRDLVESDAIDDLRRFLHGAWWPQAPSRSTLPSLRENVLACADRLGIPYNRDAPFHDLHRLTPDGDIFTSRLTPDEYARLFAAVTSLYNDRRVVA